MTREPVPTSRRAADAPGPVLLYDGACGLCGATVRFVLRHERRRTLRFAALGGTHAGSVVARHPELAGTDSVVWVEPAGGSRPERAFVRSAAALQVAGYLGGAWALLRIAWLVPRPLRDLAYDVVARHRHRLTGTCVVPGPGERSRFLDAD